MPARRNPFFARMALFMLALTVLGFPFTYFAPMARGANNWPSIIHIHGLACFAWMALHAWQTHLVAAGQTSRHREWGLAGIALSTLMVPLGISAAIFAALKRQARGDELPFAFTLFNAVDLLLFASFVTVAIATVTRHVDWHRRFMYGAALSLVGAAISRWFLPLQPLPPFTDFGPNILADLLLIPLALHDRRVLGRVHPATLWMAAIMVPIHLATPWGLQSGWWNALAPALLSLRV